MTSISLKTTHINNNDDDEKKEVVGSRQWFDIQSCKTEERVPLNTARFVKIQARALTPHTITSVCFNPLNFKIP